MVRCSFCRADIERGTGKLFIKNDGKMFPFCSNKCEKNMFKLGRKPRLTEWSEASREAKKEALRRKTKKAKK